MGLKYKHSAHTLAEWEVLNPVIVKDEIVVESDTNRLKIGDGIKTYTELGYISNEAINVKNFGIVGDGITDDTQAFSDAINSSVNLFFDKDLVIKITDTIDVNSIVKINGNNSTISIHFTTSKNAFNFYSNVELSNININLNNLNCKTLFNYSSNLGIISINNLCIKNIKDTDNSTATLGIYINAHNNVVNIQNCAFENILKLGNNLEGDEFGVNQCIRIGNSNGTGIHGIIKNITFKEIHNIDEDDNIIYEDADGIFIFDDDNTGLNKLSIENIDGLNFGKSLIKIHSSNISISNVIGITNTHDCLSLIRLNSGLTLGDKSGCTINNAKLYGYASQGIVTLQTKTFLNDIHIVISDTTLPTNTKDSWGINFQNSENTLTNANIKCTTPIVFGGYKSNNDLLHSILISNVKIHLDDINKRGGIVHYRGVSGIEYSLKNISLNNIDFVIDSGTDLYLINFGNLTATEIGSEFNITNVHVTSASIYNLARTVLLKYVSDSVIKNIYTHGLIKIPVYVDNCNNIMIDNVIAETPLYNLAYSANSTNIRVSNTDNSKVGSAVNGGVIKLVNTFSATTANRPTTGLYKGLSGYDETLSKPIYYNGSVWKDALGTTI